MTISLPRARVFDSRRAAVLAVIVAFGVSLVAIGAASAEERVRFKNGHTITALKVTVKEDMVFLTMRDGSRVGFPKELVAELEENVKPAKRRSANLSGHGGRGPSLSELDGYQRQLNKADNNVRLSGNTRNRNPDHEGRYTYGFSYRGSGRNGGERRSPAGSGAGVSVFDYIYDQKYGPSPSEQGPARISPQAQANMAGSDHVPKNRIRAKKPQTKGGEARPSRAGNPKQLPPSKR
jgi:hypothetical protein